MGGACKGTAICLCVLNRAWTISMHGNFLDVSKVSRGKIFYVLAKLSKNFLLVKSFAYVVNKRMKGFMAQGVYCE